jgi:hypothetical protein
MVLRSSKYGPSDFKKWKYNPLCDADEESISDMVNEELDIDYDEMDLETEGETSTKESSDKMLESKSERETSVVGVDGLKT